MLSRVRAELALDRFAGDVVSLIKAAPKPARQQTDQLISAFSTVGILWNISADSRRVDSWIDDLDDNFESLEIAASLIRRSAGDEGQDKKLVAQAIFSVILSLLPIDVEGPDSDEFGVADLGFASEGSKEYQLSARYERSRANRAAAIAIHGLVCRVCGFEFNSVYGPLARGYVEVHHLTPVSMMGEPRPVDPRTDLVPLCANCHRMVHRRWPPFSPEELSSARGD
ncbi:hypothetical protein CVO76_12735 [Arthrobacter agilis]|uniref:HNH nuclease domain-containing protein n=2 Tax=Arthrobacter agilis TaxID=37921 RepID=A0A2L0UJG2_9MICC|nr:hypothetical protein CVO76_12735 [Arthrobacter agilis]